MGFYLNQKLIYVVGALKRKREESCKMNEGQAGCHVGVRWERDIGSMQRFAIKSTAEYMGAWHLQELGGCGESFTNVAAAHICIGVYW